VCDDDIDFEPDEIVGKLGQPLRASLGPAVLDRKIAAFDPPQLAHSLHEGGSPLALRRRGTRAEQSDDRRLRLLRARRERPRGRAAKSQDELAPPDHSITSSARASKVGGISRPSVLAVLRLITSSTFVTCCTGKSAGFSPLRTRPV